MIGVTFKELIDTFRAETGDSLDRALSQNALDRAKVRLRRTYERLWLRDWKHLYTRAEELMQDGQAVYSLPAEVDPDTISRVSFCEVGDSVWTPVRWGVGPEELNAFSDDERNGRVYAIQYLGNRQIKVWPTPDTNGGRLAFEGRRQLNRLVNDDDVVHLDDNVVVLYAAAEDAARAGRKDANLLLSQASAHLSRLLGSAPHSRTFSMSVSGDRYAPQGKIDLSMAGIRNSRG